MKVTKIGVLCLALTASGAAAAQTYVQPYVRSDGTYVQGHYKSEANSSRADNYSAKGNYNPYTGERGTVDPYQQAQPLYTPPPASSRPLYQPRPNTRSSYGN